MFRLELTISVLFQLDAYLNTIVILGVIMRSLQNGEHIRSLDLFLKNFNFRDSYDHKSKFGLTKLLR